LRKESKRNIIKKKKIFLKHKTVCTPFGPIGQKEGKPSKNKRSIKYEKV
jgi:hypothetical protein